MELRQSVEQTQGISLYQRISSSKMVSMPPFEIDAVLEAIEKNYEETEKILQSNSKETPEARVRNVFSGLVKGKEGSAINEGAIIAHPNVESLENIIEKKDSEIKITPDAIFVQNSNIHEKPELLISDSILPRKAEARTEQIPKECKRTKNLYQQLLNFREWNSKKSREGYSLLGSNQREFINTLDSTRKNIYLIKTLGADLGIHESTAWRLFNGRAVDIQKEDGSRIAVYTLDLCCNPNEFGMILGIAKLNEYFAKESEGREGKSDTVISKELDIVRRTLANYRLNGNIPCAKTRTEAYQNDPSLVYKI